MRTLATKRERWAVLTAAPEAGTEEALTATYVNGGERAECWLDPESALNATGATTTNASAICDGFVPNIPVNKQGSGSITVIRDLDPDTGHAEVAEAIWPLVNTFGTPLWIVKSVGVPDSEPFGEGDEYTLFHVITDEPQDPTNRDGFVRAVVPLHVQNLWRGVIASA